MQHIYASIDHTFSSLREARLRCEWELAQVEVEHCEKVLCYLDEHAPLATTAEQANYFATEKATYLARLDRAEAALGAAYGAYMNRC